MRPLDILYEDNHLLVLNKPAGIATMGAESGPTMHSLAADYLKRAYQKPGRAFVGVVSRLDAMTSGALVFARTSKAASRLAPQFASQGPDAAVKIYLAALPGHWRADRGELVGHVRKDDAARRMRVVGPEAAGAQQARLRFLTLARTDEASLVAVRLITGRKHQVRVQFADAGFAIWGDRKYGSSAPFDRGIALHSWRLQIAHPTRRGRMWFAAGLPKTWRRFGRGWPDPSDCWDRVCDEFELSSDDSSFHNKSS